MMNIYKYASIEHAEAIINSGKIRFSSPFKFDDDDIFDISFNNIDFNLSNFHQDYLKDWVEYLINEPKNITAFFKDGTLNREVILDMYRGSIFNKRCRLKVSCFSKSINSRMCWVKYGDNFSGLRFNFDLQYIFCYLSIYGRISGGNVKYIPTYYNYDYFKLSKEGFLKEWLYNKLQSNYCDENEFRFHFYLSDSSLDNIHFDFYDHYKGGNIEQVKDIMKDFYLDIPFIKNSLNGIEFGIDSASGNRKRILDLLITNGYKVIKIDDYNYNLEYNPEPN